MTPNFVNSSIHNVSVVAFYQDKPLKLKELINELHTYLSQTSILKDKFQSYSLEQTHGTIIGCEGFKTEKGIINRWFLENEREIRYMNLEGLREYLQKSDRFPLTLRFGGYQPYLDYQFLSRDRHPFERSFQLQMSAEKIIRAILIGWTEQKNKISFALDRLRRDAQKFNCIHKYYHSSKTIDNDFYLCLGIVKAQLQPAEITSVQNEIRKILQAKPPIYIALAKKDLAFAKYQHPSLPIETTKIASIFELSSETLKEWTTS
ncbi:MAG: hypothetical protein AB4368_13225 [Xenococcaceae cyanobacterium]